MPSFLTKVQQDFLFYGYGRKSCRITMPMALIQLCVLFYNELFHWVFVGEKLKELLSTNNGGEVISKVFRRNGIPFHCSLSPNGWKGDPVSHVAAYLELNKLPLNVECIVVHYELYIVETDTYHRSTTILDWYNENASGWLKGKLKSSSLKQATKAAKQLNFICNLEVLEIEYKFDPKTRIKPPMYRKNGIKMREIVKYKWKIPNDILEFLKSSECTDDDFFESEYIDNKNWGMGLFKEKRDGVFQFAAWLGLYSLPEKIKNIIFQLRVYYIVNGIETKSQKFNSKMSYPFKQCTTNKLRKWCNSENWWCKLDQRISKIKKLCVCAKIKILQIYNFDDVILPKEAWAIYDIV